jgi:glucose/arabinose dehydrogenase
MARYFRSLAASTAVALLTVAGLAAQTAPPKQTPTPTPTPSPTAKPVPTITGKWVVTLMTDAFTSTPSIEFVQDGEKITGTYESGRYGKTALAGTLKARTLEFSFTLSAEGTDVLMSYRGEVAADFESIKGTAELTGLGSATWTAKRAK